MARILIAATATPGHVFPLLKIAESQVRQGHQVAVLSGQLFRQEVEATGAQFHPFDERIDFDYRHLESHFPLRATLPPGPAQMALALKNFFADAMPLQDQDLRRLISEHSPDVVLIENTFYGALPLLLGPRAQRPKIVCIGVTPLTWSSRDSIFYGPRIPPALLPDDLSRSTLIEPTTQQLIEEVQTYFNAKLSEHGYPLLQSAVTDSLILNADRFLQLSTTAFEYPRADLPDSVRFVGPLTVKRPSPHTVADLFPGDERPLVVVTQGTLANADLNQLLLPTLRALADLPVKVLALTGGRSSDAPIPDNARLTDFVSYDQVLPKTSVFITNGGYGAVNGALCHGVPIIVAGIGEDKAETAARVVWARCGINLGTSYPAERAIADAVQQILQTPAFRTNARAIAKDFSRHDALAQIVSELCGEGAG
ncbi:glycosyltransferase [Pseudomonas sp. 6D_7.1_Bac1]|uniref:glycosyltransferase n=1 Tax=Pseudomonas sp. 6D_7.1_Bac1 TaxID=2971615 RepID=UPI0021C73437|nr:nucleotide disphospho-sugar-binding domain-containing protein [Pseudomonas sp. 6D_7.1_Bac1]MCU1749545.1 glycosyltransferase [Pseudomonas sp. 6D_7.1_Bac1]